MDFRTNVFLIFFCQIMEEEINALNKFLFSKIIGAAEERTRNRQCISCNGLGRRCRGRLERNLLPHEKRVGRPRDEAPETFRQFDPTGAPKYSSFPQVLGRQEHGQI